MGRNGYGPNWSWAEMVMGRNDPELPCRVRSGVPVIKYLLMMYLLSSKFRIWYTLQL